MSYHGSKTQKKIGRRNFLKSTGAAYTAFAMINFGRHKIFAADEKTYSTRCIDLVKRSLVIDMLAPLVLELDYDFFSVPMPGRLRKDFLRSGIHIFHNAVGIGGPNARNDVLTYFSAWNGYLARHSDVFNLIGSVDDLIASRAAGKIGVIVGNQNSDHLMTTQDVELFYHLGQRCSQLTYNSQNLLGSGATERVDGGLTDHGATIVQAMNKVGMLIDVSHCSKQTTLDAIDASKVPIAITHSNCKALNDNPRLKSDQEIIKLAKHGGVMGITGVRNFVRDKEPTTVKHMVDHIEHVRDLVGIEHVGIGSDADLYGYDDMSPEVTAALKKAFKSSYGFRDKLDTDGFDHPMKIYDLSQELIDRGFSDQNIMDILGGNFLRLLKEVWI